MHHIGIAHFPVLHRQFSSLSSRGSSESSPANQDITQDSKDVLIERLNDLVSRLSDSPLEDGAVSAIHSQVDRIETLVRSSPKSPKSPEAPHLGPNPPKVGGEEPFWGGPLTPTRNVSMRLPDMPSPSPSSGSWATHHHHHQQQLTSSRAVEIAKSAEDLASKLATTVAELQTRKQESDHIHDLLITRAEKAAERILQLEDRMSEMEEDFEANQSELKFLRIQLQAIEAQCSQYMPRNEDEELTQSIMNWKVDWEDIDRRLKARKKKSHVAVPILSTPHTAVDTS